MARQHGEIVSDTESFGYTVLTFKCSNVAERQAFERHKLDGQ